MWGCPNIYTSFRRKEKIAEGGGMEWESKWMSIIYVDRDLRANGVITTERLTMCMRVQREI